MADEAQVAGNKLKVIDIGRSRALAKRIRNAADALDRELAAQEAQLLGLDGEALRELGISIEVERSTT